VSLSLLLPIGLGALAALLLPLLLHLERRTEPRPTPFAALRWLSMRTRPQRRIRLEEIWLLLLRLLLVASVAMLFARPVLFGSESGAPWIVVATDADLAQARAANRDPRAQWHWLAAGFPEIDSVRPISPQPTLSLLREIDATLPAKTELTVYVPGQMDGLDGERPRLSRPVDWRVVDGRVADGRVVDGRATPAPVAPVAAAPKLVVRHAADRAESTRYLRAAAVAWHADDTLAVSVVATTRSADDTATARARANQSDIADSTQPLPGDTRWLAWLSPGAVPTPIRRWIEDGGIALLDERAVLPKSVPLTAVWRDEDGRLLASAAALGRGRIIQLARPLRPANNAQVLEAQFPARLRALFERPPPAPQRALAEAMRPLRGGSAYAETPKPLDAWLALIAAGLFVLERWFASSSRRGRAA
jgi:hypothetical protein